MATSRGFFSSARTRLTLSYAGFLLAAGTIVLAAVYIVLRIVPNYPLTAANPNDAEYVPSRQEILEVLLQVSGLILVGLGIVGLLGGWFLAGWVLRPLNAIRDAAMVATTGRLDHRVALRRRDDEFGEVADAFDQMLHQLQDAFVTQRRFAANASHELRTPLAITATMLDVAAANPTEQDYPKLVGRLREINGRAIGLTEALLRLADANAVTAAAQVVDLDRMVGTWLAEVDDDARRRSISLHSRLAGAPVVGDPELLETMVDNLIRNAVRHNVDGGTVNVATRVSGSWAQLRIENTGRRYTPQEAHRLREPFLRGAGRTKVEGYGLGLALVDRVVSVHKGVIVIEPRQGGGLIVTITLPRVWRTDR